MSYSSVEGYGPANPISAAITIHGSTFSFNPTQSGFVAVTDFTEYEGLSVGTRYSIGGPSPTRPSSTARYTPESDEISENIDAYFGPAASGTLTSYDYRTPADYRPTAGDAASAYFGVSRAFVDTASGPDVSASGSLSIDRITISANRPSVVVAASNVEMARMSDDVYSSRLTGGVGRFILLSDASTGSRISAEDTFATAYYAAPLPGERAQIVVAVRGSRSEDFELRNGSFVTGEPTDALKQGVRDVAELIGRLHAEYPDAQISLTGHSLGGAIAQVVGDAALLRTVAFDAPGAKDMFTIEQRLAIRDIVRGGTTSQPESLEAGLVNIRYYGDVVSKIGTPFANVKTVLPSSANDFNAIAGANLLFDGCAITCHSPSKIILELSRGTVPVDGIPDLSTSATLPTQGVLDALGFGKRFGERIFGGKYALYDPSGNGRSLIIDLDVGSAMLSGIFIPGFASGYDVEYLTQDGGWTLLGNFQGFGDIGVPVSRSYRISDARSLIDDFGNFSIGLKFGDDGVFNGRIYLSGAATVPDSATWSLMVIGLVLTGQHLRRHRKLESSGIRLL